MMYDQSVWELDVMRELRKLKPLDYTDKVKAWAPSLSSTSSDGAWLENALRIIRYENPKNKGGFFRGWLDINGTSRFGYFEVLVYEMADDQSHSLPLYCTGTFYKSDGTNVRFKTTNGTFYLTDVTTYDYTKFTYSSGFTYYTTSGEHSPKACKTGRVVNLSGTIKATSTRTGTSLVQLCTVPAGCEPLNDQHLHNNYGANHCRIIVRPSGAVYADLYPTAIAANSWFSITATYISKA